MSDYFIIGASSGIGKKRVGLRDKYFMLTAACQHVKHNFTYRIIQDKILMEYHLFLTFIQEH